MEKYTNISESAKQRISEVNSILIPIKEAYTNQIKGLSCEEANLIALEYIETLHADLCMVRMLNDIKLRKEVRGK